MEPEFRLKPLETGGCLNFSVTNTGCQKKVDKPRSIIFTLRMGAPIEESLPIQLT